MRDPLKLYEEEFERTKSSPFRCLQHGDVWHNNCLFKRLSNDVTKFALVDWQVFQCIFHDIAESESIILAKKTSSTTDFRFFLDLLLWKCSK